VRFSSRWLLGLALFSLIASGCDKLSGKRPRTAFSGDSALAYAAAQVAFGPRVPGTAAHVKAGDWIVSQMKARADTVIEQRFTYVSPKGQSIAMRNVLARFRPAESQRVLYVTHWDTRPTADDDWNLGNRTQPIPGANDGASGVGLFIALADALRKTPPNVGVDLLFVDGEDWGSFDGYDVKQPNPQVLIGSTYFANHLPEANYKPLFGILWDMIGDKDLNIYQEQNSLKAAPEVVARVWATAAELGYGKYFLNEARQSIIDDHVPLNAKGLRVIDVLDIDYGPSDGNGGANPNYHHTMQDTMDKVAGWSLQVVGDVALTLVSGK
jgi:glutaminyl-peptide cyclotransferase